MHTVATDPTLAILGGGQLGRMLGLAAIPIGVHCRFLDPSPSAGAGAVGHLTVGALDDPVAIRRLIEGAAALTFEWEGVPAASLSPALDAGIAVAPGMHALRTSQDRGLEKHRFNELGIETAPYWLIHTRDDFDRALNELAAPAILKTCQGGYDGKGQARISTPQNADAAWQQLGGTPLVLEGVVAFDRELSVLACRGHDGSTVVWPVTQNEHVNGILRTSTVASDTTTAQVQHQAHQIATQLMDALGYVGVIAIELFQVGDQLIANEFAPRVHNSGHWTIEGSHTSQFENHVRAVLGMPLGSTALRCPTVMINALGSLPDRDAVLALPGAHFHSYGKAPRAGRKVGHITLVDPTPAALQAAHALVRQQPGA